MSSTPAARPQERRVPPTPMTFEEFLAWVDEDIFAEWVDGEVLIMSPASTEHQRVRDFLLTVMRLFVEARRLGEMFSAPYLMRLPTRPSGREPDLFFVAAAHADRVKDTFVDGPADLVVEIVSPDSEERDRVAKFGEYEGDGIPEYWLIDPLRRQAAFYGLSRDGRYHSGSIDADGVYRSAALPDFWLRVAWLWQRPLPPVAEVFGKIQAGSPA